jgi:glycosyltransferase involved in cell wall biosynthesis
LTQTETTSGPVVSVIIPAYNAARFIKETLDSVFAQTYPHFQAIVVNDGSPDAPALEEILEPYRSRIIYLKQENRGLSGARNTGLRAATGEFVALLDADDIWEPDYLQKQVEFLQTHPEFDLVYCNAKMFGDSTLSGQEFMTICPSEGEANASAIITRRCNVFVSVTARRSVLAAAPFDESLRSSEDYDCWLRLAATGHKIGYHRLVLVNYRKHPASLSADPLWMAQSNLKVLNKSLPLWPSGSKEHQELSKAISNKTATIELLKGKNALKTRNIDEGISHLEAANEHYKSPRLAMILFLLKLMPGPIATLFRLRNSLFKAYREG